MKQNVIAIDGPAGAGKSTVARQVATALGFVYIDTGAMYRAVACRAIELGLTVNDQAKLAELAARIDIRLEQDAGALRIWADGSDVTEMIRSAAVTAVVASISQAPEVRRAMVRLQREMAETGRAVLDGRDIGTVVVPDACVKIFLTASSEERARRRYAELKEKGYNPDLSALKKEMEERDRMDCERDLSPLVQASDAVLVDTTGLSIEDVVSKIATMYRTRCDDV